MLKSAALASPALLTLTILLTACSSSEPAGADDRPRPTASADVVSAINAADITLAEQAVRSELPDAPIWEGMKFEGVIVEGQIVCVDRTYREGGGLYGNGGNAGYVLVTFPDIAAGQPQDGKCADVASTPAATSIPPAQVPSELKDKPGLVTRDALGAEWPLTVDYAVLACEPKMAGGRDLQIATLTAPDGKTYALNGTAKDHTDHADIGPIWAEDPQLKGLKVGIGPLIDRARALC